MQIDEDVKANLKTTYEQYVDFINAVDTEAQVTYKGFVLMLQQSEDVAIVSIITTGLFFGMYTKGMYSSQLDNLVIYEVLELILSFYEEE